MTSHRPTDAMPPHAEDEFDSGALVRIVRVVAEEFVAWGETRTLDPAGRRALNGMRAAGAIEEVARLAELRLQFAGEPRDGRQPPRIGAVDVDTVLRALTVASMLAQREDTEHGLPLAGRS